MTDGATIWVDGSLVPAEEATVHVLSHAVQRGSTVFDVLGLVPGPNGPQAVGLRPHVARFQQSMALMGMETNTSLAELEAAVAEVAIANPGNDLVKLVATWSFSPSPLLPDSLVPELFVAATTGSVSDPSDVEPVRACTALIPKMPSSILPPALKVGAAYTAGIRQKLAARRDGFDEIVFKTDEGHLAEAVSQSVFVVSGDRVLLPPLDVVLDGITRRMVLEVLQCLGNPVEVRQVYWDEVTGADELFLSSTTNPVLPVRCLDDREMQLPGPVTTAVGEQVSLLLEGKHELSGHWLTDLSVLAA